MFDTEADKASADIIAVGSGNPYYMVCALNVYQALQFADDIKLVAKTNKSCCKLENGTAVLKTYRTFLTNWPVLNLNFAYKNLCITGGGRKIAIYRRFTSTGSRCYRTTHVEGISKLRKLKAVYPWNRWLVYKIRPPLPCPLLWLAAHLLHGSEIDRRWKRYALLQK